MNQMKIVYTHKFEVFEVYVQVKVIEIVISRKPLDMIRLYASCGVSHNEIAVLKNIVSRYGFYLRFLSISLLK